MYTSFASFDLVHSDAFPMASGRLPLIGHVLRMMRDMPGLMRAAHEAHGDFFRVDMGFGTRVVVVANPVAYELLSNKRVSSDILNASAGPIVEGSLMGMDGRAHRRARKAMGGAFSRVGLRASEAGGLIASETSALVERWSGAESCAVVQDTRELALSIVFRLIGAPADALSDWSRRYFALLFGGGRIPGPVAWRGKRAQRWLNGQLAEVVLRCRAEGKRDTLVGALAHGEDDEGQLLEVDELVPSLRLLVLAGHETSATSISWCLLELAEHPELWERLLDEVGRVERAPEGPDELAALPFCVALVREIMRLYTPAPVVLRRTTEPIELGGQLVEEGCGLLIPLILLNRDPTVFPNPDAFLPDRWLASEPPSGPPQIAPFGGGPHTCLGLHLAQLEVVHVLVAVAKAMGAAGRRPSRRGRPRPSSTWFPLAHPALGTRLWWVS